METPNPTPPYSPIFRVWWVSFLVLTLIGLLNFLPEDIENLFDLKGTLVDKGEWWRLITSQFIHLTFNHTLLNITGYFIVAFSFRQEITPLRETITLFICILGVGIGIWKLNPDIYSYVGLSGAIYGMLASYVIIGYRKTPFLSIFFILYLIGKFGYEQLFSTNNGATEEFIGGLVAIDSHLYGAATGLALGIIWYCIDSNKLKTATNQNTEEC